MSLDSTIIFSQTSQTSEQAPIILAHYLLSSLLFILTQRSVHSTNKNCEVYSRSTTSPSIQSSDSNLNSLKEIQDTYRFTTPIHTENPSPPSHSSSPRPCFPALIKPHRSATATHIKVPLLRFYPKKFVILTHNLLRCLRKNLLREKIPDPNYTDDRHRHPLRAAFPPIEHLPRPRDAIPIHVPTLSYMRTLEFPAQVGVGRRGRQTCPMSFSGVVGTDRGSPQKEIKIFWT